MATLRWRIKPGTAQVEKEPTPQGLRYVVLLEQQEPEDTAPASPAVPEPARTELLAQVVGERDWLRQRVVEQEQIIARLTQQSGNYQVLLRQEQEMLRLLTAGQTDASDTPTAPQPPTQEATGRHAPAYCMRTGERATRAALRRYGVPAATARYVAVIRQALAVLE